MHVNVKFQGPEPGQYNGPVGLSITDKGYIVVCDVHNNRIQVRICFSNELSQTYISSLHTRVSYYMFVKLVLEIAGVQQAKTHYRNVEGVVDPNRPPVSVSSKHAQN